MKGKQSLTLVKGVRADYNQVMLLQFGERIQQELHSTLICVEVTRHYKRENEEIGRVSQ